MIPGDVLCETEILTGRLTDVIHTYNTIVSFEEELTIILVYKLRLQNIQ